MMRHFFKALSIISIICVSAIHSGAWVGKCVAVADGDTISVMRYKKPIKIRLYGVDCPERGQDFGAKAKQFTSIMVFGKQARIDPIDEDRYGRVVAWVWIGDVSLNRELIRQGLAWYYRRYAPTAFDLFRLETEAKAKGIGLWSLPKPTPPWEFRKAKHKKRWKRPWYLPKYLFSYRHPG